MIATNKVLNEELLSLTNVITMPLCFIVEELQYICRLKTNLKYSNRIAESLPRAILLLKVCKQGLSALFTRWTK